MKMPGFLRRSLRRKVTALVMATTVAALAVAAAAQLYYTAREYRETELGQLRTQAAILGRASVAALVFNDRKEAGRALEILGASPAVELAALYAPDGQLFATYPPRLPSGREVPARAGNAGISIEADRISLFEPIVEDGQVVGAVYLRARYTLPERLLAYAGILAAAIAAALAAALLLSSWLQRALTEPLLGLAAAARRVIEKRDLSVRAAKTTEDEIGVLAEAMNAMLADLEREIAERSGAEAALRAADQRKDEFLATLAHELRNPLAPIRNSTNLLKAKGSSAPTDVWAREIIDRQSAHMARLLDDLLDVARISRGKLELRKQRSSLRAAIESALETSRPAVELSRHSLVVDLPAETIMLDGDPVRLSQMFANLLTNAAKYTDPGGRIVLAARREGAAVTVTVSDNGIGIAPEMLERIFEIFTQATPALQRSQGGLGIGLFLVKALVEMHGGSIRARSAGAGRGSEFTVRLPVAAFPGHAEIPARPASQSPKALRVLVVDDNRDAAESLASLLRAMGNEVMTVFDGLQAVDAAATFRPDIAVIDIGMPRLNGYDAVRRIREAEKGRRMVAVALTGWGQEEDRKRSLQAGFDRHLTKPVTEDQLAEILTLARG
jgi:signal transduction histidine kinase/CheY-like chemotaxis protein